MELNLLAVSIGIGLVVSLLFSELFGLAAGGLVVPGYVALYITRPLDLAVTLGAALFTLFFVRILATFVIIYGRRRTALMILVGYATGVVANALVVAAFDATMGAQPLPVPEGFSAALMIARPGDTGVDVRVIGYIVPGLIAIWLDRQGVLPTLAALLTSAVVVRLLLILVVPEELRWFDASTANYVMIEEQSER
ncbi:MAG: poly-gamma-glutamate biosynthesis protein PgsC [Myxococcales bacterium]|nr:MAG: poly-gamma-glutamate biosynthesis protein PgsC [Myxococcales bacterium]